MPHWLMWTIGAAIFMVAELITTGFFAFWFGIGALLAALFSFFFRENIALQWTIFIVTSAILLFISRKFFHQITKDLPERSGYERLIGKSGIVTEEINEINNTGLVRVEGDEWRAKSSDLGTIAKDSNVDVASVNGNKLIVTKSVPRS
jgi:membrane protein implicated in regulation of membrane protease activity